MGDEIEIKNIEIIQGGLVQLDLYNVSQNRYDRAFCDPDVFFKMIGDSMQENFKKWVNNFHKKST